MRRGMVPAAIVAMVVASVIVACEREATGTTLRSALFPTTEIVCVGEVPLTADVCLSWGEKLLAGSPKQAPRTSRLVLTANAGNARCGADFFSGSGGLLMTASAVCPW